MTTYKQILFVDGSINQRIILCLDDNAYIPNDPDNRDYVQFQADVKEGAIVLPPDPIDVPVTDPSVAADQNILSDKALTTDQKVDALIDLLKRNSTV